MPTPRTSSRPHLIAAIICGGVLIGASQLHPALAVLSWVGMGLLAAGLCGEQRWRVQAAAIYVALLASIYISQIWEVQTFTVYMRPLVGGDVPLWLSASAWGVIAFIAAAHHGLPIVLSARLLRRLPVRVWLPVAFLAGEAFREALAFSLGDLMHAHGYSAPVLRSVGLIGLPLTALLGCYAAAAVGEAIATRRALGGLVAVPVVLWFACLPPLPAADAALHGLAAVHMATFDARPQPKDARRSVAAVIWPESSFRGAYRADEGRQAAPQPIEELSAWSGPHHVVSLRAKQARGHMNAIGVTDGRGWLQVLRGKSILAPGGERPYSGLDPLVATDTPGEHPPLFETVGGRLVPTICYEVYSRALFLQGVALGGEVLVNIANDRAYGSSELGPRQALGVLALRAAETHRPAIRASGSGPAALVSSAGTVIASSAPGTSGLLHLPPAGSPRITVLSDGDFSAPFPCTAPGCVVRDVGAAGPAEPSDTVVVSGHSLPPRFLGLDADTLAAQIAAHQPELVVLDTCYGFAAPLLAALARQGVSAIIVGPQQQVASEGLVYDDAFFAPAPAARRAAAVSAPHRLQRWPLDAAALRQAQRTLDGWDASVLTEHLQRLHPNLVRVPLGDEASALFPVSPERFRALNQPSG